MAKNTDGRKRRALARRAAWESIANLSEVPDQEVPRGVPAEHAALYWQTRESVVRWIRDRSKGVLGPPPGGVGVRS